MSETDERYLNAFSFEIVNVIDKYKNVLTANDISTLMSHMIADFTYATSENAYVATKILLLGICRAIEANDERLENEKQNT